MNNISRYILSAIFIVVVQFSMGQNFLSTPVSKDYSGYKVLDFFQEIEKEYQVNFFYKENWIDDVVFKQVSTDINYEQLLKLQLGKFDLAYIQIQDSNIVLVPNGYALVMKNQTPSLIKTIGNPLEKGKYSTNKVEGHVYYGKTGEPIIGAVVYNRQFNKQTTTDYNGYYSMNLPGGVTKLSFSFIGLETSITEVEVFSHGTFDYELFESSIEIAAINVIANGGKSIIERSQMGLVHIDIKSINKLPVLMGETDIVKSMTLLPGVQTPGEISSGFNVRGGNVDQNLVIVDGVPMYNTTHLFGMFSTLIPQSVSNVELHKGTQTARFGGRLSSVMDVSLKMPDTTKIKGKAGIGVLNSTLFIEGPVIKDFCSVFIGGRTTYSNWLLRKIPDIDIQNSSTNFYDLIAKVNLKFNKSNSISLFGYYSTDYFNFASKNEYTYGSLIAGLNYRLYLNQIVSFKFNAGYTNYNNELSSIEDPYLAYTLKTGIEQLTSKAELNLAFVRNNIELGIEANNFIINPGKTELYSDLSEAKLKNVESENAIEFAGFIQDNFSLTERINLLVGLRYSWYSKYGPDSVYKYSTNGSMTHEGIVDSLFYASNELGLAYQAFEPRLGLKVGINDQSSVKLGYHVSSQYQHLITNSSSSTPSDYWKSADRNIKPMRSQQFSVGYFRNFLNNTIEASSEVYFKTIENSLEYRDGAILNLNSYIEQSVLPGNGRSYGFEFMLKKNSGKFNGWLSYTLSRSEISVDGETTDEQINRGEYFPTYNDRLHDFSISASYQLTRRWNFAGNFIFITGRPATFPEYIYEYRGNELVHFSDRNKYRMEPYHRMDISVTYDGNLKKTKKVHPSITFAVYNLYGHKNTYATYYKHDTPSAMNGYNDYGLYKLSIIGIPIPSLTLNLTF